MSGLDVAIMDVLRAESRPMTVAEVSRAVGRQGWSSDETTRAALNRLTAAGALAKVGNYSKTYQVVPQGGCADAQSGNEPTQVARFAVDIPRLGHEGITDPDILDEIEAEKVWTCATAIRAANTAWGIDMGIDADVREARALMAESRRQVRDRAPLGDHYMEGEPKQAAVVDQGDEA